MKTNNRCKQEKIRDREKVSKVTKVIFRCRPRRPQTFGVTSAELISDASGALCNAAAHIQYGFPK